jgi:GntR family transcriptional regulator / MocR family aminotransferase
MAREPLFALELEPESEGPLHVRISRALALAIRSGRLKAHQALPSASSLASQLSASRNTVIRAYQELEAEGWIKGRKGSGTYVSDRVPELTPLMWGPLSARAQQLPDGPGFELPSNPSPLSPMHATNYNLDLSARPDSRFAPTEELAKAASRAMRLHGERFMEYGEPSGNGLLREQLALWLNKLRGLKLSPDQLLITRGSQMGMGLILSALFSKEGFGAVESLCDPGALSVFRRHKGLSLVSIPIDTHGLDVEALETVLAKRSIRFLFLTPHAQRPTGVSLSPERRTRLLALAQAHRFAILEEDSESEYHYAGARPAPLAATDLGGHVIHMGSLSRLIAPGLRLGFIAAPRQVIERLTRARQRMDVQGDRALEWAMMRDGIFDRHLLKAKRIYQTRRDALVKGLRDSFSDRFEFDSPSAGLSLWLRAKEGFEMDAWILRARSRGLWMEPGVRFSAESRPLNATRIGFGAIDESEMENVFALLREL